MKIDYEKTYNNRDPDSLYKWVVNKDGTFESCNIFHLIDFFNQSESNKNRHCSRGFHFCECDFESVISDSSDPDLMRNFLIAANIIDETLFHILNQNYEEFRSIFPLPRFESHEKRGEVGNINLIHKRDHKDEQERVSYYRFNYEVTAMMIDSVRFFGQTKTNNGFLDKIILDNDTPQQYDFNSIDIFNNIIQQSKMCVMGPFFYSVIRREMKTSKKLVH